jgi:hypothetical protein
MDGLYMYVIHLCVFVIRHRERSYCHCLTDGVNRQTASACT